MAAPTSASSPPVNREAGPAPAHTRFAAFRFRLEHFEPPPGWRATLFEFLLFGFKQGWACLFGGLMLALILVTGWFYPALAPIGRYDFLTLSALAIQATMLGSRLESWEEAKVILAFHVLGTVMELFKTAHGSWLYPEAAYLRIGGVPLFSGFMYAAVGSYIARVWRIFDFRYSGYPPRWATIALAIAIYINFFAHHWLPDIRIALFAITFWLFRRTIVWFRPFRRHHRMPLLLGWLLVALFIWFGENIGTFSRAWAYPNQKHGWELVPLIKLGAWYLLMIISFVLVSLIHRPEPPSQPAPAVPR